jgi:hypothetical protein
MSCRSILLYDHDHQITKTHSIGAITINLQETPSIWAIKVKLQRLILTGQQFYQGTQVSSTNKTDLHNITEIFLKVVLRHHKPNQAIIMTFTKVKCDVLDNDL